MVASATAKWAGHGLLYIVLDRSHKLFYIIEGRTFREKTVHITLLSNLFLASLKSITWPP